MCESEKLAERIEANQANRALLRIKRIDHQFAERITSLQGESSESRIKSNRSHDSPDSKVGILVNRMNQTNWTNLNAQFAHQYLMSKS